MGGRDAAWWIVKRRRRAHREGWPAEADDAPPPALETTKAAAIEFAGARARSNEPGEKI